MDWLNYHHLFYFYTVAREGSVTAAASHLRLSQPTVSGQIKMLEESLGEKLFQRVGRRLELTEMGKVAYHYAQDIFSLGTEMKAVFDGRLAQRTSKLRIGVSDLVPKLMLHHLIEPALALDESMRVICREDKTERLLAELAIHDLDIVLAEVPIAGQVSVRAYNHLLGESTVSFYGKDPLPARYRENFPHSLDGAPILVPTENTLLRRSLDHFFEDLSIHPKIVAEFEDSALLKAFGMEGVGLFPGPTTIEKETCDLYGVEVVGRTNKVIERFYAITVERRIKHPAARAISEAAKTRIFTKTATS